MKKFEMLNLICLLFLVLYSEVSFSTALKLVEEGRLFPYQKGNQDISGSTSLGDKVYFVDDGVNIKFSAIFEVSNTALEKIPRKLPLGSPHQDMEGLTSNKKDKIWITTSMGEPTGQLSNKFTELEVKKGKVTEKRSVELRSKLLNALKVNLAPKLFDRIQGREGKKGGINVEGVSLHPNGGFVFALRSPLSHNDFAKKTSKGRKYDIGEALLVFLKDPFSKSEAKVHKVNLGGAFGFRGFEYVESAKGFIGIGGAVDDADGYGLWWISSENYKSKALKAPGMGQLCRPESLFELNKNGKSYLAVFSEESGNQCKKKTFRWRKPISYLLYEIES